MLKNISHSDEAAVTLYLLKLMLLLAVRSPFPGVFPEVGDATAGQQLQKAQGTPNISSKCLIKLNITF